MPNHDPTLCRDQLANLIAAQNTHLAALENLLTQEYELLQARNAEGLEKAGTARQQCVADILRVEDERGALCRATGRNTDDAGLQDLLAWCDPTRLLAPEVQEYLERTRRCRELNDRNGMLVNGRLQQQDRAYGAGSDSGGYSRKFTTRA
jgi:flagellar biosynthesis/type III secretory pathway chaperone